MPRIKKTDLGFCVFNKAGKNNFLFQIPCCKTSSQVRLEEGERF